MENLLLSLLPRRRFPLLVCFSGTLLIVGAAFGLRLMAGEHLQNFTMLFFFPAIFLSALVFDRGSGFFATLLSAGLAAYFFIPPIGSFGVGEDLVPFLLFVLIASALAGAVEALRHALDKVASAEREKDLLLHELAHRTKNDFMTIASILRLQAQGQPEEIRTVLSAAADRVHVVAGAHEQLHRREEYAIVNTRDYLEKLCDGLGALLRGVRPVEVRVAADPVEMNVASAVPMGLIVNELVTNAMKYAFPGERAGTIEVGFHMVESDTAEIVVRDDGIGCPEAAREGLGSRLVRLLAQQMKGSVDRQAQDRGCRVVVRLRVQPA